MYRGLVEKCKELLAEWISYFGASCCKKDEYFCEKEAGTNGVLADIQRKGVDAANQFWPKCAVNGAVAVDAGHGAKGGGADQDVEMSLAAVTPAAMATVRLAIVNNFQPGWRKSGGQA